MKKYTGKMILLLLLMSVITILGSGCETNPRTPIDESAGIEVVATIFPLADMASRLGGEKVTVTCLLPAGASPHTFEPTVDQGGPSIPHRRRIG